MRIRSIAALGLAGILISACSSGTTEQSGSPNANSNVVVASNTSAINAAVPVDANTAAFTSGDRPPGNAMDGRLGELRKKGAAGPPLDVEEYARKNAKPAPDNSTFTSYLTDAGYEIRTFNNHPELLRVEKKTTSEGKQTLKIFLKNGKVVETDGNRINPLSIATARMILDIAGVPERSQPAPGGVLPGKKPQ